MEGALGGCLKGTNISMIGLRWKGGVRDPEKLGILNPENANPEIWDSRPIFVINTENPEFFFWNFFDYFFG